MLKDFQKFILRGNVVDLAVGVVMGAAFGTVVSALVKDLLTPLIGAIVKVKDFSGLSFTINGSKFLYGEVLNAMIAFLLVAIAVFFFVVTPLNALMTKVKKEPPMDPTTKKCPECTMEIPLGAKRCPECTAQI